MIVSFYYNNSKPYDKLNNNKKLRAKILLIHI